MLRDLAEREGFEPPEPRSSTVFKTAAIDHSATSPKDKSIAFFLNHQIFFKLFFKNFLSYLVSVNDTVYYGDEKISDKMGVMSHFASISPKNVAKAYNGVSLAVVVFL